MPVETSNDEVQSSSSAARVDDLLARCHNLLNELEQFQTYLVERKKEHTVELRHFRNSVLSELKSLERLSEADPAADRTIHTLRSSNLPFYSAVWTAAKSCTGLVTFTKRFYWDRPPPRSSNRAGKPKKRCALVDIVAQDGEEWVKVSTITENRLLFEKAKAGWEGADSSSESCDGGDTVNPNGTLHAEEEDSDEDDDDRVELLKMADDLRKASQAVRIRYKHPRVRFVLPKISEGSTFEIDKILADIRATGATVQCGDDPRALQQSSPLGTSKDVNINGLEDTPLEAIFSSLLIDPFSNFTPTLNIDCTILLALVSDLSHGLITPEPWFHPAIRRQIDLEAKEQLLRTSLWPAMGARALVCTFKAARRMREIVGLIGTEPERIRMELLLGEGPRGEGKTAEELRDAFDLTSSYPVPKEWRLPIKVVHAEVDMSSLPRVAEKVAAQLTEINKSVFLFGWLNRWTTISSNRTVAKLIESVIEGEQKMGREEGGEVVGPQVWLCPTARSLVGKEKGRKDGREK